MSVRVDVCGEILPGSILRLTGLDTLDPETPLPTVLDEVMEAVRAAAGHDRFVVVAGGMSLDTDPAIAAVSREDLRLLLGDWSEANPDRYDAICRTVTATGVTPDGWTPE